MKTTEQIENYALFVWAKYGDGAQGNCGMIAEEIADYSGGEITAGYLVLEERHRKEHWWVTMPDGLVVDPMADNFRVRHDSVEHIEVHRDISLKYW